MKFEVGKKYRCVKGVEHEAWMVGDIQECMKVDGDGDPWFVGGDWAIAEEHEYWEPVEEETKVKEQTLEEWILDNDSGTEFTLVRYVNGTGLRSDEGDMFLLSLQTPE